MDDIHGTLEIIYLDADGSVCQWDNPGIRFSIALTWLGTAFRNGFLTCHPDDSRAHESTEFIPVHRVQGIRFVPSDEVQP